jgi:hypothetical protein
MLPSLRTTTVLACLALALASTLSPVEAAKRRSRLELPIVKPAEAPPEDNIATASGSEPQYEKVEAPATEVSEPIDEYTDEECDPDNVAFELITGYVFSAPDKLLDSIPGTLMLTDCLEACENNDTCASINYETGLCVLFSSNADKMTGTKI